MRKRAGIYRRHLARGALELHAASWLSVQRHWAGRTIEELWKANKHLYSTNEFRCLFYGLFLLKFCLYDRISATTVLQGGVAEIPLEWRWCLWKITTSKILWPLAYLFWRYWHLYFSSANNPDIRKPPQNLPVAGWIFFPHWIGNPPCGRLSFHFYYTTFIYFCNTAIQT